MNAYWALGALALFFTVIALWRINIVLAIVSSVGWVAFLYYHLNNLPSGITAGDTSDTYVVMAIVGIILAVPLITIARTKGRTGRSIGSMEGDERESNGNGKKVTLSSMNTQEYQAYLKGRIHRRK